LDFVSQVTSDTGIQSHRVELKVETPEAFILADEEYHIDRGSRYPETIVVLLGSPVHRTELFLELSKPELHRYVTYVEET
jgi:hypothetical protein